MKKQVSIDLDKFNPKGIRMCTFSLDDLIEISNLAMQDYKDRKINNFDYKDILNIIIEFIRLKNDYDALIKFVNGTDLKDTMTQFLVEQSKENK